MKNQQVDIFTIGHSNSPAAQLVTLLNKYDIQDIVDVRSAPYSKYAPQFNREVFEHTLKAAGINYIFAGDCLGGRPKDPACYEPTADDTNKLNYALVMQRPFYKQGIARLIEIAGRRKVAIMCSEENPSLCHRHLLISQTLLDQHVSVWHIRKQGILEEAQPRHKEDRQLSFAKRA